MTEFISFIFSAPNFIATFILSFCILYWIIVMLGAIDMDMVDVDIDVDADVDADIDPSGNTQVGVSWLHKLLHFFNLGRIPFMIWLTIVGLITWFGVVTANYFLRMDSFLVGLVLFLVVFIAAMVVSKPITFLFVKLFDSIEKSEGLENAIGQMGEVVYPNKGNQPGEVEIVYEGSHIKIFALPSSLDIKLTKNQKVLVISKTEIDNQVYIVEPYN